MDKLNLFDKKKIIEKYKDKGVHNIEEFLCSEIVGDIISFAETVYQYEKNYELKHCWKAFTHDMTTDNELTYLFLTIYYDWLDDDNFIPNFSDYVLMRLEDIQEMMIDDCGYKQCSVCKSVLPESDMECVEEGMEVCKKCAPKVKSISKKSISVDDLLEEEKE